MAAAAGGVVGAAAGPGTGYAADLLQRAPVALQLGRSAFEPPLPPLPDQLEGGRVEPPSRTVPAPRNAPDMEALQELEEDLPTTLPFEFNRDGFVAVLDIPEHMKPWRDRPTRWENVTPDTQHTYLDADGVIQYRPDWDEPGYDQPVTQIQFGLGCITAYRTETDPARKDLYLTRAKA
ncbi:hypothetical protein GFD30_25425, partial [Glycomyces sp. NEAU-7082]